MHRVAQFVEMLNEFSYELCKCYIDDISKNFLQEEINVLEEARGIGSSKPVKFVKKVLGFS